MQYHCITHQRNACRKSASLQYVMMVSVKTVNFVRSNRLNYIEFQTFLNETEAECGDVTYFSHVRWLSRGNMLEKSFELREAIGEFMAGKGKLVPTFGDE